MSATKTRHGSTAFATEPVERDVRTLLGQVMGFVAVAVGFTALGAYLGRDLSGATGLVLFVGALACIVVLNIALSRALEQLPGNRASLAVDHADDEDWINPSRRFDSRLAHAHPAGPTAPCEARARRAHSSRRWNS